jgi:hypothetical protein
MLAAATRLTQPFLLRQAFTRSYTVQPLLRFNSNNNNRFTNRAAAQFMSCVANDSSSKRKMSKIGTHDGSFHCDEALGCFLLQKTAVYEHAEVGGLYSCVESS